MLDNNSELLESERWSSFLESTADGLQLELTIISLDGSIQRKVPAVCPMCRSVLRPPGKADIKKVFSGLQGELELKNGKAFASPLLNGLIMIAMECHCVMNKAGIPLVNRGRIATKLLSSFQKALSEGIEGGQRAVELSTLRKLNHFVLSLCQGERSALQKSFDLILSAVIILLDAAGSWLEFTDPELPDLVIKGDGDMVKAARQNPVAFNAITVEVSHKGSEGKLGVIFPRDQDQAAFLIPLLSQECTIALEIYYLFRLLNKQLNRVLGAVTSAVVLIDKRHNITYANKKAEVLMKRPHNELPGSPITDWKGPWLDYLNSETVESVRGEKELFKTEADPLSRYWVDWQVSPLLEESTIMGWLLLFDDRTEYYRWQDAARQAERLEITSTMVGALAHELRNPISAAKGLLQLMGRRSDPEQSRNYSDLVLRELDRVTRLLNEFLLLGKPADIEIEPLDPVAFLRDLFPLFEGEVNGMDIEIISDIQPEVSPIAADTGQLTQVMLNLVRNAVQAVTITGKVIISLRERDGQVFIDVEDNGPGLTPEVYSNLFKPFFTTKERGAGLGLAVVQAIVHNHGGMITASNKPEGGAVFSLSFPVIGKGKIDKIDVVIAVREDLLFYPAERALISAGFRVMTYSSLELANREADRYCPGLIITEYTEDIKWSKLLSECKSHWPNAKFLLLRSAPGKSLPEQTGFINYLDYPLDLTQLISVTNRLLGK